jgi:hypothetical protein
LARLRSEPQTETNAAEEREKKSALERPERFRKEAEQFRVPTDGQEPPEMNGGISAMTFYEMIDKIMPEVERGGDESFLIYRDADGGWHGDFTRNQYGETYDWVAEAIESDKAAFVTRGRDFAHGSMPYVYDKVLSQRLRNEHYNVWSHDQNAEHKKVHALLSFFEDNAAEFSRDVTEYLATVERPLAALLEMCPFNLATGREGWTFNKDLAWDAIDKIENTVADRLSQPKDVVVPSKRVIDGYTERLAVQIAGITLVLAENAKFESPFLVCNFVGDKPGAYNQSAFPGYVSAMSEFVERQITLIETLKAERGNRGLPIQTLTAADCIPGGLNENLIGKLIVIKPENFIPERQTADYQLKIALNGFGCSPTARGTAIICQDLYSGKDQRFERDDVAGVLDPANLPYWAAKKLALREAINQPGVFEFGGYHFKPYRKFERRDGDFNKQMSNAASDHALGIATCDWGKSDYSHTSFYAASCGSDADIFRCIENGKLYVPCENELFRYNEPPQKS